MKIKVVYCNFDKNEWNKKATHPLQSWEWGEARKEMGIEVLRLNMDRNVYQLSFHKIPFTHFKIGYLPRSNFPSQEVLDFLYDYGQKNKVIFIKIEPYEKISNLKIKTTDILVKSPHPLFPQWTQILDLTQSEKELLKNMHHKTRYNIRLAQKKGIVVKEMNNEEGFKIFCQLYFETCKRQKYFGHNPTYHKIIWNNLKKNIARILIAFYKNIPLAAYELFYFKKIIYYPYGGTSLLYRNFMASNLLMWEAIRLGKKIGAKKFDMWGSLPPTYNQNHPWAGFTRFKQGYGGKYVEMVGSYDLVINKRIYHIYNLIYPLRNIYLAIKRLI